MPGRLGSLVSRSNGRARRVAVCCQGACSTKNRKCTIKGDFFFLYTLRIKYVL